MKCRRRRMSPPGFAQVSQGLSGCRPRGEFLFGKVTVTAARGIIGQPKQLLVSEASNLFDLVCSEIAAVQGAIPIPLLQHTKARGGPREEWDRRTGPPIPRPKLWVRSQAALGSVCHRGFEERSHFRFVRSLDQVLELLKSVQS